MEYDTGRYLFPDNSKACVTQAPEKAPSREDAFQMSLSPEASSYPILSRFPGSRLIAGFLLLTAQAAMAS